MIMMFLLAFLDVTDIVDQRLQERFPDLFETDENGQQVTSPLADDLPVTWNAKLGVVIGLTEGENCSRGWVDLRMQLAAELAAEIREAVFSELGYTCSAGVATNKTLAKIGSGMNKPNMQTILLPSGVLEFMKTLPFQKIRSLGGKFGGTVVEGLKISTAGDLWEYSEFQLCEQFGNANGVWLYNICRGICLEHVVACDTTKSMGANKEFRSHLPSIEKVEPWLIVLSAELFYRLTEDYDVNKRWPKSLILHYKTPNMTEKNGRSRSVPMPRREFISDPQTLFNQALSILKQQGNAAFPCSSISLSVTGFVDHAAGAGFITNYFQKAATGSMAAPAMPSKHTEKVSAAPAVHQTPRDSQRRSSDRPKVTPIDVKNAWSVDFAYPSTVKRSNDRRDAATPLMTPGTPSVHSFAKKLKTTSSDSQVPTNISMHEQHSSSFKFAELDEDQKADLKPIIFPCIKCGQMLYHDDPEGLREHADFHFAQELQREQKVSSVPDRDHDSKKKSLKASKSSNNSATKDKASRGTSKLTNFFRRL